MQEMSGETYQSSQFAKALCASDAKVGKTTFLVCQALGAFPNQKYGGVVDKPEHLHILTFDANALGGLKGFITSQCKKGPEYLKYRVYNHQDEWRRVSESRDDWNFDLYNAVQNTLRTIRQRAEKEGGTHLLVFSSLTGLAEGILRAIAGPPDEKKKGCGMDPSKWQEFSRQLIDIRNAAQVDVYHCMWEAHIDRGAQFAMKKQDDGEGGPKETIHVPGQAGRSWGFNVEQVFRIRRSLGDTFPSTNIDRMYLDTRPSMEFISGGRSFTESLDPKEYDLTLAFHKLGLKIGRFGAKAKKSK